MRFILEHSLSPRLAEALGALSTGDGHEVHHLRRWFPQNTPDSGWLLGLKERGEGAAIVITADPNIYRNPALRAAWVESGLSVFFLKRFADIPHWEQAAKLVKWWPDIVATADRAKPGVSFTVAIGGKIEQMTKPA